MGAGEEVRFPSGTKSLRGYLVLPDGAGPHPGAVVIHEAYGLNQNIRQVTERLGAEGYAALAVDLFTNRNAAVCMARFMTASLLGREPVGVADLVASLDHLASLPQVDRERIGAVGFCLGGSYAIAWGSRDRRLRAIAPFYGMNPRPVESIKRMCPVVASYPGKDFTAAGGRRLEAHLESLAVPRDFKVYPGARHSFFNDRARSHDPAASADAWQRLLAFFGEHVRA